MWISEYDLWYQQMVLGDKKMVHDDLESVSGNMVIVLEKILV